MYDQNWMKRVLIPFWVIRILFSLILIAAAAIAIQVVRDWENEHNDTFRNFTEANYMAGPILLLSWCGATILFDVVEILLFIRRSFGPIAAVVLSSVKEALWLVVFVFSIIGTVRTHNFGGLTIFFVLVILLTTTGQLIYASVVLHRYRKGGQQRRGTYQLAYSKAALVTDEHTSYDPTTTFNPFQDPSREPSPLPTPDIGAGSRYYDGSAPIEPMYDPQQNAGRHA